MAFNYTKWLIDLTREYIKNDIDLKNDFTILEDSADNDNKQSIRPIYTESDVTPSIIFKTNENRAISYNFARKEAETAFTVEIGINCDLREFKDTIMQPLVACEFIAEKLSTFYEDVLGLRRLTYIDPVPIREDKTVYVKYMRYSGTHNLIRNTITK